MTQRDAENEALPVVDVIIEDDRWRAIGLDLLAERAVWAALAELALTPEGFTVCLMACDDARIAELNATFRGKGQPTNVLSWPSQDRAPSMGTVPTLPKPGPVEDPAELGDMALAYETCMAEAAAQGKSPHDHVTHLIVHATLHLLGYDHIHDVDCAIMEALEVRVLASLGVADPY
jgi:probable rRNA maturation factor